MEKAFLIELNKNVQKILYRSVRRSVFLVLEGGKIDSYIDDQCHEDLHNLDLAYENDNVFAKTYQSLLEFINW